MEVLFELPTCAPAPPLPRAAVAGGPARLRVCAHTSARRRAEVLLVGPLTNVGTSCEPRTAAGAGARRMQRPVPFSSTLKVLLANVTCEVRSRTGLRTHGDPSLPLGGAIVPVSPQRGGGSRHAQAAPHAGAHPGAHAHCGCLRGAGAPAAADRGREGPVPPTPATVCVRRRSPGSWWWDAQQCFNFTRISLSISLKACACFPVPRRPFGVCTLGVVLLVLRLNEVEEVLVYRHRVSGVRALGSSVLGNCAIF